MKISDMPTYLANAVTPPTVEGKVNLSKWIFFGGVVLLGLVAFGLKYHQDKANPIPTVEELVSPSGPIPTVSVPPAPVLGPSSPSRSAKPKTYLRTAALGDSIPTSPSTSPQVFSAPAVEDRSLVKSADVKKDKELREYAQSWVNELQKEREHERWIAALGLSMVLLFAALFIVLSKRYPPETDKWAFGLIGTLVGFWLKGPA